MSAATAPEVSPWYITDAMAVMPNTAATIEKTSLNKGNMSGLIKYECSL
jgi:hypothetical protein